MRVKARRLRAALVAVACGAVLLGVPDIARAAPPQPTTPAPAVTTKATPSAADAPDRRLHGVLPANLVAKSGSYREALQKFQALRKMPSLAGPQAAATRRSAEQGRTTPAQAAQAAQSGFAPPRTPDPAFVQDCAGREGAGEAGGYVLNRFQWCQNGYAIDLHFDSRGTPIGSMIMYFEMIGYGRDDGTRNVTVFVRPKTLVFDGLYTPATTMSLDVVCTGGYDEMRGCSDGGDHRFTMAEWEARALAGQWVGWEISSDEGSATDPFDAVLYHSFTFQVGFLDGLREQGAHVPIRCDSAPYFDGHPKACIFYDVLPHLQYALTDSNGNDTNYRAVAEHIRQAQDDPNSTYPPSGGADKNIPGKYTGGYNDRYLTRVPSKNSDYPTNEIYLRNEGVRRVACFEIPTPTDMEDPECDEYPFASTYEGAANDKYDFSVRYVPGRDNSSAGAVLGNYYDADRILYFEDEFWVEIVNQAGGSEHDAPVLRTVPEAQGPEGSPIKLFANASAAGTVAWNYAPIGAYDEGTYCYFANPDTLTPTFTCNDDGIFDVIVTLQVPGEQLVSARVKVTVLNVAPSVSFKRPARWQLFRVNSAIVFEAPVVDPGANDDQRCQFTWDDGTTSTSYPPTDNCLASKSYEHAGMYTVDLRVTDDDGGVGTTSVMIVVFDPAAGSANIDGSATTPAGSLPAQPAATGQTWLHYTGAYVSPAAGTPYGQNKVWMDGTSFRFEGTGMSWQVITPDGKVAALGAGTINGQGGYTWVTYGWDACAGGSGGCQSIPSDRIRMAILDNAGGVVYDNAPSNGEWDVDRISPRDMTSGAVQIHR